MLQSVQRYGAFQLSCRASPDRIQGNRAQIEGDCEVRIPEGERSVLLSTSLMSRSKYNRRSVGGIDEENFDPDAEPVDEYGVDAINGQSSVLTKERSLTSLRGMLG